MSTNPLKTIIIDDDSFLLEMYGLKFKKENFEVELCTSAEVALDKIENGYTPDIVILDMIMPKMDGLDFLRAFREKKLAPQAVVIVLSNQGQPNDIEKAKELNVNGYIVKATTIPSEVVVEVKKIYEKSAPKKAA